MANVVEQARKAVEEASGKPVIIQAEPNLKLIAKIDIGRGDSPTHVITYNPKYGEATDYHIVFQCGYALRLYQLDAAERFDLRSTEAGREEAGALVTEHFGRTGVNLPDPVRGQLRDQLYDGLILQLRSVPLGFRVDDWVRTQFPSLVEPQQASATRQMAEYQAALSPQVRQMAPEKIFRASIGMNAAFAAYWSRLTGDPMVVVPYRLAGMLSLGERLLAVTDQLPPDASADRELIASWGKELGIESWFSFSPFGG